MAPADENCDMKGKTSPMFMYYFDHLSLTDSKTYVFDHNMCTSTNRMSLLHHLSFTDWIFLNIFFNDLAQVFRVTSHLKTKTIQDFFCLFFLWGLYLPTSP